MLNLEEKKVLIGYRKQKAYESLKEAKAVANLGFWTLTGNRLYYAAFHMASALLLDKGIVAKTHSGVIHLIGAKFVMQGRTENMGVCFQGYMNCGRQEIMMICMMFLKKKYIHI